MIKPLSWSEYSCYKWDPNEYYTQYILGIKPEPSREMILGSIIHEGFEGKDWKQLLIDNNFTPDYIRTVEQIMKYNLPSIQKEVWLGEYGKEYEETGCKIAGRADGIDEETHTIVEIKTGKSFWDEEKVKTHGQLTLYSFLYWKQFGVIPQIMLISFNVNNGKAKTFFIQKTEQEINNICVLIKEVVSELKKRGWWEKRISSKTYETSTNIQSNN